ncbi:hypothetical protein VP01_1282g2 [Puccinia sorghi]|uniref:Uncharacterized protein n=1 Tax=Puccinia sorghi TaxID=27349 RepID=A0A0L6VNS0_9BASI|nr:hypothetical protein VP01_1282g2 [Puccinia sorghi]
MVSSSNSNSTRTQEGTICWISACRCDEERVPSVAAQLRLDPGAWDAASDTARCPVPDMPFVPGKVPAPTNGAGSGTKEEDGVVICQVVTKSGKICGKNLQKEKSCSTKNLHGHLLQIHCLADPHVTKKTKVNHIDMQK